MTYERLRRGFVQASNVLPATLHADRAGERRGEALDRCRPLIVQPAADEGSEVELRLPLPEANG